MFDTSPDAIAFGVVPSTPLDELRSFAGEHQDPLLDAAGLLGGSPGIRLAQNALDGLAEPGAPSRRTLQALDELLDLLMLEHVHDPSRIEAELFAMTDRANACVEELCLLADQLRDLIDACRKAEVGEGEGVERRDAA